MKHDLRFLEAVHDLINGGNTAKLRKAMEHSQPSAEDVLWVLNIYHEALGEPTIRRFEGDLVKELARIADKMELEPHDTLKATPRYDDEGRGGENGVHTQNRYKVGMGKHEPFSDAHPPSKTFALLRALRYHGWRPITMIVTETHHNQNKEKLLKRLASVAEHHGIDPHQAICHFDMGARHFTMISPELYAKAVIELNEPLPKLFRQPGDRVKSLFPQKLQPLLDAVAARLGPDHAELAIAHRNAYTGTKPHCVTRCLYDALRELDMVQEEPDVHRQIRQGHVHIRDMSDVETYAEILSHMVLLNAAHEGLTDPVESWQDGLWPNEKPRNDGQSR